MTRSPRLGALPVLALVLAACGDGAFLSSDGGLFPDSGMTGTTHDSSTPKDATHDTSPPKDAPLQSDVGPGKPDVTTPPTPDSATPDTGNAGFDAKGGADASGPTPDANAPTDANMAGDVTEPMDASAHDSSAPHDASASKDAAPDVSPGAGCPSSPPSGGCTMNLQKCVYPTASCVCSSGAPPSAMIHWNCSTLAAGCPDPEPAIGSMCSKPNLVCNYGACMGGDQIICQGGTWQEDPGICPG